MGGRQSVQIASIVTQVLIDFLMEIKLRKQEKIHSYSCKT